MQAVKGALSLDKDKPSRSSFRGSRGQSAGTSGTKADVPTTSATTSHGRGGGAQVYKAKKRGKGKGRGRGSGPSATNSQQPGKTSQ